MRSFEIVSEVRSRLNLSSDVEALRMLITIGYDKLKDILPIRKPFRSIKNSSLHARAANRSIYEHLRLFLWIPTS